jgi:hypothetical protein
MEFMLMPDGSVKTFGKLLNSSVVLDALNDYMGVAYYWQHASGWSVMHAGAAINSGAMTNDVPDVIKLAAMLE